MELLLYAAGFVLWESTVSLSPSQVAVASYLGRARLLRGRGYRVLSPWPGDLALVLERASSEHAFSLAEFRAALALARRDTRVLRACCEIYLIFVFAAMPVAIGWLGAEAAWLRALPLLAALQIGTLVALYAAERRAAAPPKRRVERWLSSALFPPALLRTPSELVAQRVASFHPATALAAVLDEPAFVRMLREELGRHASDDRIGGALLSLCEQRGVDRSRVLAPTAIGSRAVSYCPICLDEFLVERARCLGCGVDSIPYPGTPST